MLGIAALVLAWRGVAGLRAVALPLAFLLFAVPIPAPLLLAILFKLQLWTATYAGYLLYVIGEPALVSGDQILRATQTFQVVEGCSGMRTIETLAMLTLLLIDLFGRRGWHAAILLLATPVVAFALNGVRVLTLILNPHSEVVSIHNLQGIALLLVGLLVIAAMDFLMERRFPRLSKGPWHPPSTARDQPAYSKPLALGVLGALVAALPLSRVAISQWEDPLEAARMHQSVREALDDWPSEKIEPDFGFRGTVRFAEVFHRRFETPDGPVIVFLGTADLGQRGGSLLSEINRRPGSGWRELGSDPLADPSDQATAGQWLFEKGKRRRLVRHWYVGDRGLLVETLRSLLALDRSPFRREGPLHVVRLESPVLGRGREEQERAVRRIEQAHERLTPALSALDSPLGG